MIISFNSFLKKRKKKRKEKKRKKKPTSTTTSTTTTKNNKKVQPTFTFTCHFLLVSVPLLPSLNFRLAPQTETWLLSLSLSLCLYVLKRWPTATSNRCCVQHHHLRSPPSSSSSWRFFLSLSQPWLSSSNGVEASPTPPLAGPHLGPNTCSLGWTLLLYLPPLTSTSPPPLTVPVFAKARLLRFLTTMDGSSMTCPISSLRFGFCVKFYGFEVDLLLGLPCLLIYLFCGLDFGGVLVLCLGILSAASI